MGGRAAAEAGAAKYGMQCQAGGVARGWLAGDMWVGSHLGPRGLTEDGCYICSLYSRCAVEGQVPYS